MHDDLLFFNGLMADGTYLTPPMTAKDLASAATSKMRVGIASVSDSVDETEHRQELKRRISHESTLGTVEGVDPSRIGEAGWGIVFPAVKSGTPEAQTQAAIREALGPLIALRRGQAGAFFREYAGESGPAPGEGKRAWLERHGVGSGPANPTRMPYYLLLVGDPEQISFTFQYQLDVQYAVGRIHFDTIMEYACYAASVAAAETQKLAMPRRAAFFGVAVKDDPSTLMSADNLIRPLAEFAQRDQGPSGWQVSHLDATHAYKRDLAALLGGPEAPAFFMTASHGMAFDRDDSRLMAHQGALICQDWPGPKKWKKPVGEDLYFSADDLPSDANLLGQVGFIFACYGAGTPRMSDFAKFSFSKPTSIAPRAFMARLPQKMLSLPRGGALAVIGHVERAWATSFLGPRGQDGTNRQLDTFQSQLKGLLEGKPVGLCMEPFNERYAELSTDLTRFLEDIEYEPKYDPFALAELWTLHHDARNYIIFGDPAVRLLLASGPDEKTRESIVLPSLHEGAVQPGSGTASEALQPSPTETEPSASESKPPPPSSESHGAATSGGPDESGYQFSIGEAAKDPPIASTDSELIATVRARLRLLCQDLGHLEVHTRVDETPAGASESAVLMHGPLATTRIHPGGQAETLVHPGAGPSWEALLGHHQALVKQTAAHQLRSVEVLLRALAQLTGVRGPTKEREPEG